MDGVENGTEPTEATEASRRAVVVSLLAGLSGCSALSGGDGGGDTATDSPTRSPTASPTASPTETTSPTDSPTETEEPTDSPTETPEPAEGYVDLRPADPEAAYADHSVFARNDGAVVIELDLHRAWLDRHFRKAERIRQKEQIQAFISNIDDPEWRKGVVEDAKANYPWAEENIEDTYDHDQMVGGESSQERFIESNLVDGEGESWAFWTTFARGRLRGVSSTNNELKATALQGLETRRVNEANGTAAETDAEYLPSRQTVEELSTIIYDHTVEDGAHGVYEVLENVRDRGEDLSVQRTLLGETDPGREQQLVTWENSDYKDESTDVGSDFTHGAEAEADRNEKLGMVQQIADVWNTLSVTMSKGEAFLEAYRNPKEHPLEYHADELIAAGDLAARGDYRVELDAEGIYVEETA